MTLEEAAALVSGDNLSFANGDTAVVSRQGPGEERLTIVMPAVEGESNPIFITPGIQPRPEATIVCLWMNLKDATKVPPGVEIKLPVAEPPLPLGPPLAGQ